MKQWLAAAVMLAAIPVLAETGKVGPPKSEFKDGPFYVSWRYVTPSSGMVYATPKLKSKKPPRFTAGEAFEVSITLRVAPGTENPCARRLQTDTICSMEARLYFIDATGKEVERTVWQESRVLQEGIHTFYLRGGVATDVQASRGYINFRVRKADVPLIEANTFPFRIVRP